MFGLLLLLCLGTSHAQSLSDSETSYSGASILEGEWDVTFEASADTSEADDRFPYAFFEGNTLYVGNSDTHNNTIDAIVEFFWFQSSIDRGTDFYVAVIKTRATPGDDCYYAPWEWARGAPCKLWADEWSDWGEYPVLSVEAMTDIEREQGAFRWDWSVPFESYGIDAYGQVTFQNKYGIGETSEGAIMAHAAYPLTDDGEMKAEGNVQVKGFHSSEYSVQTQYEVTLYEWDVFVDGRADLMAWDMYLNLGERETMSAYHEYFLSIQVEEGTAFKIDEMNFVSNFDTGWYDPFRYEMGVSLIDLVISPPLFIPASDEPEQEDEPEERIEVEKETDTAAPENPDTDSGSGDTQLEDSSVQSASPKPSGCSVVASGGWSVTLLGALLAAIRRKD